MDKHKSYGYEGGFEDWNAEKVLSNMRIRKNEEEVAEAEVAEDVNEVAEAEETEDVSETADDARYHDGENDEDW